VAIADKEHPVSDVIIPSEDGKRTYAQTTYAPPRPAAPAGGFFDMYKPGQGYYTRVWSGVGYGVLVCWFAYFLYEKLDLLGTAATAKYVQVGVPVAVIIALGLVGYWALARNQKICDFLIATEGEMKKVNWTSRKEIIGSTKVVVFVVIALSIILFVVDIFFMLFFNAIGILKGRGFWDALLGVFQ